ncbi:hypothetical protein BH09PAT3_BH09PAT3_3920 [soil metagenome]
MGNFLTSLFVAAGVAALSYSKLGKRVGYGNGNQVWMLVGIAFVLSFAIIFILLKTLVSLD